MASRIAVVGSINADLVVLMPKLPDRGETVTSSEPKWFPGGKGANQAVAAARMGGIVCMVGAVGSDAPGEMCLAALKSSGVNAEYVLKTTAATSTALVMVEDSGENQIVVTDGANSAVEVDAELLASFDAVVAQFEIPEPAVLQAAKATKGIFIVNAAPVRPISEELSALIDVLIVNEHEFEQYGKPAHGLVIVTAGSKAVVAYQDGEVVAQCQPKKVEPVDTVGAGDTFVGAFAVAYAGGSSIQAAIERACAAGALSTLKLGAQSGMPNSGAVDVFMQG